MVFQGKVHNGVVVLDNGAKLAEGLVVRVVPMGNEVPEERPSQEDGLFDMSKLAVDTGIPDLVQNIDHYLSLWPSESY